MGPEPLPEMLEDGTDEVIEEDELPDAPGRADFEAGIEAFRAGDFEDALNRFTAAAEVEETNGEAWMATAHAGFAAGDYEAAAKGLAEAGALGGFPRGYRFDPKPAYPDEKTFDKLFAKLEKHATKEEADADAHLLLAYFHVAMGEREKANAEILAVLELRPEDETAPLLSTAMLPAVPPEKITEDGSAE